MTKARIWRATIHMSGGSSLSRMTEMADGMLSKLEQDGIITPFTKAVKQQESTVPSPGSVGPEGGAGK